MSRMERCGFCSFFGARHNFIRSSPRSGLMCIACRKKGKLRFKAECVDCIQTFVTRHKDEVRCEGCQMMRDYRFRRVGFDHTICESCADAYALNSIDPHVCKVAVV